ncbi:MAG: thioredoxin-disulfide reductase [Patescibacteria group bacterium]|jgi:thioredoxin reductase (NADPH)
MNETLYDVLVLGGGPAGYTASIYTSRAQLKTANICGPLGMGQLTTTSEVENFPGFPEGVQGPTLVQNMRAQAEKFGTVFADDHVASISGSASEGFTVTTQQGKPYKGRCVIVATGASAKWLGLESEQRLRGRGVSACATCDGFFFRGKVVAVVGGGDSAMEESTFLTKFATKVYLLIRKSKDEVKAGKFMMDKAFSNEKIEVLFNTEVEEVLGDSTVSGLKIVNNLTGEKSTLDVQGLFVAIGHAPNTKFLEGFIDMVKLGYVDVKEGTLTSKEGVFAAGDVADWKYRQAITAAGFGCMAALDAERYLSHIS